MYASLLADGKYSGSPNSTVAAEGGFVTIYFLAGLYVTLFSAYIFLRCKNNPSRSAGSLDFEAAEYRPVLPPKRSNNTPRGPAQHDKRETTLRKGSQEVLQYPFTPQELPESNGRPSSNRGAGNL
ncbi:hypothetical protein AOQ84DRAFT_391038 [Glonium stellatum]|uniref:Uncharacterized protein n=1 Tax=Glonium stellatum TaxID=574774 RepID=A0A8E2EUK5_9PEZI|nr:hypothetical protein AOQ84DRAFT_391038 [Glonium stellatum]